MQVSIIRDHSIVQARRLGYALRQAFAKDDAAYTAAMAAIKGSYDMARRNASDSLTFAFPIIVVDAPLFECHRTESGDLELSRVQTSDFVFSGYVPEMVTTCIKVVHRKHLPQFASEMKQFADAIRRDFKKEEGALMFRGQN